MVIIREGLNTIENDRRANEANMNNMLRLKRNHYSGEEKVSVAKLRNSYRTCLSDAVKEESVIRDALDTIIEIRNIRHERRLQVSLQDHGTTIRFHHPL